MPIFGRVMIKTLQPTHQLLLKMLSNKLYQTMKTSSTRIKLTLFFLSIWLTSGFALAKHPTHNISSFPGAQSPAKVVSPSIPQKITFCDRVIDLTRFDVRERIDRELLAFSYMHSSTLQIIKRANRYFPIILPILRAYNIPEDFIYLMVIESKIDEKAKSPAGACGLWQIMKSTGKDYGLEINRNIDERFNLEKATEAACKYLRDSYKQNHDWSLVALAYNAGNGRINRELKSQGVKNPEDLYLVSETSRYLFRILACKILFTDPAKMGFQVRNVDLYPPLAYDVINWSNTIPDLALWAKQHGTTYRLLKLANPWMLGRELQDASHKEYLIKIIKKESLFYDPNQTKAYDKQWTID